MPKYTVKVTEENSGFVVIEADDLESACDRIYDAYEAGEVLWHNTTLTHISADKISNPINMENRYLFKDEEEFTTMCVFDTDEEMRASGLLYSPNRTTCFVSGGKYYVGGHFDRELKDLLLSGETYKCKNLVCDNGKCGFWDVCPWLTPCCPDDCVDKDCDACDTAAMYELNRNTRERLKLYI